MKIKNNLFHNHSKYIPHIYTNSIYLLYNESIARFRFIPYWMTFGIMDDIKSLTKVLL